MTFHLTRPQFEAKKLELAPVVGMLGESGLIFYNGIKMDYHYSEPLATLTVTIKEKPFLLSESVIESQVRSWLESQSNPPQSS